MTATKWACLALALLLLTIPLTEVGAHGYVVRAIPADRSTLERPPTRLQYWFSEDLEPRFSEIKLRDQSGQVIASGGVDEKNHALLALRVLPDLPDGAYIVELRPAFASDGHVIAESRVFFVGDEVGGVSGQAADDRAIPLEVLWRAALNLANFLFFGATTLYVAVLLPAWGSASQPGGLPPRIMRRLRQCVFAALALAFGANFMALVHQSMVFFNASADQVIAQNLWQVVLIGSRFGDVWTFRLVLLIFSVVLIFAGEYYRALMPQLAAGIWRGLPWLGALFIGLSMVTSHAAGSTLLPWVAIAVDWLHALAVAFWLGGTLVLVLLLPIALAPYERDERDQARRAVMLRFSVLVTPLVALIIISGLYNALNYFLTPADVGTSYGRSLGVKLLLALPGIHHWWLSAHCLASSDLLANADRAATFAGIRTRESRKMWRRRGGVAAGSPAHADRAGGGCLAQRDAIPEPRSLETDIWAPQATEVVDDFTLSAAIVPGGPGVNTYDVVLSRAGDAATDVQVHLQLINPERERRSRWHLMEQVENGLIVAAGDDIDTPGNWWSLVDIIAADGEQTRAAFVWEISESASIQQWRQPTILNLLALLMVVVILAVIVYPWWRRLVARLNVSPVSALLGLAVCAISAGILVIGAVLIGEQQRNYELTLNPPPTVVNAVLPDAESLRRGEALYREHCLVWQGQSADFRALRNRLGTARDDFLYGVVSEGWRNLPPCGGALSERDRWDVINYFRTFEVRETSAE